MLCKCVRVYAVIILSILSLYACSNQDSREWFETEAEAIQYGLHMENGEGIPPKILSTEEYRGETLVFFDLAGDFGAASISRSEKGYSWYRTAPHFGFEGGGDYSTGGFELLTESGVKIPIICGKSFDSSIEKMVLSGDGPQKDLTFTNGSRLYYSIHEADYNSLEVTPVRSGE
ncbi:hypothetical protein CN378_13220 [Bacillus sp. AFS015802]|uniref:hypothetical protein n=1 Tax=Bacillus sp. AFS015802 TaxID=2033486 RepID=UPI000BF6AEA4|nr:hypothetical protein [Bacillus sp. AFS015802]PFA66679.1 hypothetical protein CN378_13220 [Bacillus sp. AFS015802]